MDDEDVNGGNGNNGQVKTQTMILEDTVESEFDVEKYIELRRKIENKYQMDTHGGYMGRSTSEQIKFAKGEILEKTLEAEANKRYSSKLVQNLYVGVMKMFPGSLVRILENDNLEIQDEIARLYVVKENISRKFFEEKNRYNEGRREIMGLAETKKSLSVVIEGYTREMQEIDYIINTRKDGCKYDPGKLTIVDPDIASKESYELRCISLDLEQSLDRAKVDLMKTKQDMIRLGGSLQGLEYLQQSYQNDQMLVLQAISAMGAYLGFAPTVITCLMNSKIDVADDISRAERINKQNTGVISTAMEEFAKNTGTIMHPEGMTPIDYDDGSTKKILAELDNQTAQMQRFIDYQDQVVEAVENKYL